MTMMEAARSCFENFATFSGRARRAEYWKFGLFNFLANIVFTVVGLLLSILLRSPGTVALTFALTGLYGLVTIIPSLSVSVRRLHDIGKSGACLFFILLPVIGGILVLVWTFQSGQPFDNQYGPDPKSGSAYAGMVVRTDTREKEQARQRADREQRRAERAERGRTRRESRNDRYAQRTDQRDQGRGRERRSEDRYSRNRERDRQNRGQIGRREEHSIPTAVIIAVVSGIVLLTLLLVLLFSGRGRGSSPRGGSRLSARSSVTETVAAAEHIHSWEPANCVRPAICTICGTKQGSALGHSWEPATYDHPRRCKVCGETDEDVIQVTSPTTAAPVFAPAAQTVAKETDSPAPSLSSSSTVELFTENKNYSKAFAARVAHSQSLSACESVVKKLRNAGYNAYLYEIPGESGYAILIGVFQRLNDAESMCQHLHDQPAVKGARLDRAYSVNVYLSDTAVWNYEDISW